MRFLRETADVMGNSFDGRKSLPQIPELRRFQQHVSKSGMDARHMGSSGGSARRPGPNLECDQKIRIPGEFQKTFSDSEVATPNSAVAVRRDQSGLTEVSKTAYFQFMCTSAEDLNPGQFLGVRKSITTWGVNTCVSVSMSAGE